MARHRLGNIHEQIQQVHAKIPIVRSLPFASLKIILLVTCVNALIWLIVGIVLRYYPHLSSSAVLAYTLGLRHALDADHISAIDLTTRRLLASRRTDKHGAVMPVVTVGMWFSLGHSTIVIITTILVAATTAGISSHFDAFSSIGGIIGSSVSTAFLLVLGAINAWLLWKGIINLRRIVHEERRSRASAQLVLAETAPVTLESNISASDRISPAQPPLPQTPSKSTGNPSPNEELTPPQKHNTNEPTEPTSTSDPETDLTLRNRSCLTTLLRWSLRLIDRPWKIYPLGLLFGLGFDTSSEIALLGITTLESSRSMAADPNIASSSNSSGTIPPSAVWAILIFPLLFTAGMCLLDTTDGALMYALYTSAGRGRGGSALAMGYANVVLTGFTVLVAVGVGVLQFLNMLSNVLPQWRKDEDGAFWDGVAAVGSRYDVVGGVVCGGFVVVAVVGWAVFGWWKRRVVDGRVEVGEK